jgi:hypothetical protein
MQLVVAATRYALPSIRRSYHPRTDHAGDIERAYPPPRLVAELRQKMAQPLRQIHVRDLVILGF